MERTSQPAIGAVDVVASMLTLSALAVSQPMLDLLGRSAGFFVARAAPPLDIVALGVAFGIVLPLVVAFVILGVHALDHRAGIAVHAVAVAALGGILVLQVLFRTPLTWLPAWIEIGVGLGVASLGVIAFHRYEAARLLLRFAAVAPLVVVGLFLFGSPTSQLLEAAVITQPAPVPAGDPSPVVMLVFDEFPVASLMNAEGDLQADVYPNFARLARDGTWFPNAITVQQQTEKALPAIVTGNDPGSGGGIPTAGGYPANLFSLLAGSYELHVREAITELCPEYACANRSRPTLPADDRLRALASDLQIVAGHVFLPDDIADDLPPIDQNWSNFGEAGPVEDFDAIARFAGALETDRRTQIETFLDEIEPPESRPRLDFLHALVPHVPWQYLQSGQTYPWPSPAPGSDERGWGDDEWLVAQAYQLHLVQVMYADTVVGQLIDRLEELGMYDDALVVVVADHGITIRPDVPHRRVAYDDTLGDIAAVPLFIKRPHDPGGDVDRYRAETIDVLPTIADVLDVDVPWEMDGISLFAPDRPERSESRITGSDGAKVFGVDGSEAIAVASRKIAYFGVSGPYGLAPAGYRTLLGTSIHDLPETGAGVLRATIVDRATYFDVEPDAPSLPARVHGFLIGEDRTEVTVLAIAVNDTIVAITRSELLDAGSMRYSALIPPESLVEGDNTIRVYAVRGTSRAPELELVGAT